MHRHLRFAKFRADSAIALAVISGTIYMAGNMYTKGYYAQFGLHESQLDFSVAQIMEQSLFPLLYPVFFLAAVAELVRRVRINSGAPRSTGPFHPVPTEEILTVVLGGWVVKVMADFLYPSTVQLWYWNRRDVILLAAAVTLVAYRFWYHLRRQQPPEAHRIQQGTFSLLSSIALGFGVGIAQSTSKGYWALPWFTTLILLLALVYAGYVAVKDVRAWNGRRKAAASTGEPPQDAFGNGPRVPTGGIAPNVNLYLLVAAAVALLLGAGIQGAVAGQEAIRGCSSYKAVTFEPAPPGTVENETYWMVLYSQGVYYVREPPGGNASATMAVPQDSSFTARTINAPAPQRC